jgi:hypothetical protein
MTCGPRKFPEAQRPLGSPVGDCVKQLARHGHHRCTLLELDENGRYRLLFQYDLKHLLRSNDRLKRVSHACPPPTIWPTAASCAKVVSRA